MTTYRKIIILPVPNCRRSRKVIEYLETHDIPFTRVDLMSSEGQTLAAQYELRASPGILVDGLNINPFDLLIKPACRIDEAAAQALFSGGDQARSNESE